MLHSAGWALALYHLCCLVPVIVWGRALWRGTLKMPSGKQLGLLVVASVLFSAGAIVLYKVLGDMMLNSQNTFDLLVRLGYNTSIFLPLSIYFIVVNSALEEFFWRGVVLNKLDQIRAPFKHFGLIWSSIAYAGFHYSIMRLVLYPGWAEVGTILLAVYGALLAVIYRRSGSIIWTSLCHALLTDTAAIVLIVTLFHRLRLPL